MSGLFQVTWLGTSSGLPTRERGVSALLFEVGGRSLLLDCGEGTQNTLFRMGLNASAIDGICITHVHGDHTYGLPGLLSTLWLMGQPLPILIAHDSVHAMVDAVSLITNGEKGEYPRESIEENGGLREVFSLDPNRNLSVRVFCGPLKHRVPSVGFRIEVRRRHPPKVKSQKLMAAGIKPGPVYGQLQRGKDVVFKGGRTLKAVDYQIPSWVETEVFAYLTDTEYCEGAVELARGADLISHEATFLKHQAERAKLGGHSTVDDALRVFEESEAKYMVLTHFSARNKPEAYQAVLDEHPFGSRVVLAEDGYTFSPPMLEPEHDETLSVGA